MPIHFIPVKSLRIKGSADPFKQFAVFGMPGVSHGFEKILITGYTPHSFRGTCAGSAHANGVPNTRFRCERFFYFQGVMPIVVKMVVIYKLSVRDGHNLP